MLFWEESREIWDKPLKNLRKKGTVLCNIYFSEVLNKALNNR